MEKAVQGLPEPSNSPKSSSYTPLKVNLNPESAAALKDYVEKRHISYTEAVRRAIALLKFVDEQILAGRELQVTDGETVQKVVFIG